MHGRLMPELDAGNHVLICDPPRHCAAGMFAPLTVK
jgi:hypothetical protein